MDAQLRTCSWDGSAKLGTRRKLHLEGCTFAGRPLDPDAPAVHLDGLLGDREPEAGAALCFGTGTVDLVELFKDAHLLGFGDARPRVRHADGEVTIDRLCRYTHFSSIREFDGVADEVEEHLC